MLQIQEQVVPIRIDEDGVLRVGQSRVPIDAVVYSFQQGQVPEEIVLRYPSLRLVDVYGVIHYYLNHRDSIDQYLHNRESEADEIQREIEARPEVRALRERILARAKTMGLIGND